MTGLELLKQKLIEKGATKQQAESKVIPMILEIFEDDGTDDYKSYKDLQAEIIALKGEITRFEYGLKITKANASQARQDAELYQEKTARLRKEYSEWNNKLIDIQKEKYKEIVNYIDSFNKSLSKCETEEGRDALRIAQTFINTVNIDTKYDNTAFINGLASILAARPLPETNELKKITPPEEPRKTIDGYVSPFDDIRRIV